MLDILNIIPGKKRLNPNGWHIFNAVCCHHRGHKPDKRQRGGLMLTGESFNWTYHCFNCGFKAGVTPGKQFSGNTKRLLEWCDVDKMQIERMSFYNFTNRDIMDINEEYKPIIVSFDQRELPEGSVKLDPENSQHQIHIDYLANRGLTPETYTYYVTPDSPNEREQNRIIIPYYYNGRIVGYTSRFYDGRHPKYLSEQQKGYVFNTDAQHDHWNVCVVVEGQFDAIAIGGCAVLGSTISEEQAKVLKKLRKKIIVVPDRDSTGMTICNRALELGYSISIPEWGSDVKDVNDAVKKYGKFQTLLTILQAESTSKIILEMKRKQFK